MTAVETDVHLTSADDASLADNVQVRSLRGTERLGDIYALEVSFVSRTAALDGEALLGLPLALEMRAEGGTTVRRIHGIASTISDLLTTEHQGLSYQMVLVPRLWRLTLTRTTEIFMDMTVPEVIEGKLKRAGFALGTDFELRLRATYAKREYIVQYEETDYDFVSRLAEHMGITLFIEQGEQNECAVFTDHNDGFKAIEPNGTARFFPRGEETGVYELRSTTSQLPAQYVVKDYNYRTPQMPLVAKANIPDGGVGLRYEYGGHFKTPDEAAQLAQVRAEEVACRRKRFNGLATNMRFAPGVRAKLEGHPLGEPELLITEVVHDYAQTVLGSGARGDEHGYRNQFTAIFADRPFRPPRKTPKPKVYGHITAQIEAEADGPYAHLDDEGRYRVRFLFDLADAPRATATRLVRMAQPHTGPGYGFHFPLRHGVEVLITFIDGDPDRPIISTAVPNPQTPSVVGSNNGTRNIIRTGAGNEINIDDTSGEERIKLSTPYGSSSFQIGSPNSPSAGAALNTTDAYNAVAGAGVTTASTAVTTFSDIASIFASADIVAFAGGPNLLNALLEKGPAIIQGAAKVVDGVLDTAEAYDKVAEAEANEAAQHHKDEVARAESRKREAENNKQPAKAKQAESDAANHQRQADYHDTQAKSIAASNAKNADARAETKRVTKAASTAAEVVKAGKGAKDLWSKASDLAKKGTNSGVAGVAATIAAVGSGLASAGRIGASVPAPGSPKNIQAAASGAALVGLSSAMVSGAGSAAVLSAGSAILAGGAKALVKSPAQAEVAGLARTLITSGALIDALSGGVIKYKSGAMSSYKAGAAMGLTAGAAMTAKAGAKMTLKAGAAMTVKAGAAIKIQAGAKIDQKAGGAINIKAGGAVSAKAGGKFSVNAGGNIRLKGPKVGCIASGAKMFLSGSAVIDSGGKVLVKAGGSATMKGSSCMINGSGGVTLKGPTVKAKGRCLLG